MHQKQKISTDQNFKLCCDGHKESIYKSARQN